MGNQLVWFRNDLRLRDHEPLTKACQAAAASEGGVVPVYISDPRFSGSTSFGFQRIGPHRRRFLDEALLDLRKSLRSVGSELLVFAGRTEDVLRNLAESADLENVWFQREFAPEEKRIERKVRRALGLDVGCHVTRPATLFDPDELPFPVSAAPEVFTRFRKCVEQEVEVAPPLPAPVTVPALSSELRDKINAVQLKKISILGHDELEPDPRAVLRFEGGETTGLKRLDDYFWQRDCLSKYKQTRNRMLGANYSSKFSAWLACGCLSARTIYHEVRRYEQERVKNDSTDWLVFELLWREYFSLMMAKHGAKLFQVGGLRQQQLPWRTDWPSFNCWREGKTGYPFIDANMRELAVTGFMSNRGRQNVASFLTKNLGVDWRMGAEWFESMLIDYDPSSNYGNWNYTAGVGNDARGFRWFNTLKQARDYDPRGEYVRHWLPELAGVPATHIHTPWKMHIAEQKRSRCVIGVDYPHPVVDLFQSAAENEQRYQQATISGPCIRPAADAMRRSDGRNCTG